jgi:hypothetical protein
MRIKARDWNEAMRDLCTRFPLIVNVEENQPPVHAWYVNPVWDGDRKKWMAKVRPGSVNCRIATISMQFSRAPEQFKSYIQALNPQKKFSDNTSVDVPLDFGPLIDLTWREIGGDASPTSTTADGNTGISNKYETIPAYFRKKGVVAGGSTNYDPNVQCKLYACDLVLSMPRPYLVNEISVFPGGLLGGSIVSVDAKPTTPPNVMNPPKIYATPEYIVQPIDNSFEAIFFQRFIDEPADDLHLSTVYALSQPLGSGLGADGIDETYRLETRYYCNYNLAHSTQTLIPRIVTPPLRLVTGLAAGLGDTMFNFILSLQNDFTQAVVDLFNQRSMRGKFWVV